MRHPQLGGILGWKHNHAQGIRTSDGCLTDWPVSLGPWPTDEQLQGWIDEWSALPEDSAEKNPGLALQAEIDGLTTIAQVKVFLKRRLLR
jgi:hypothetical protein